MFIPCRPAFEPMEAAVEVGIRGFPSPVPTGRGIGASNSAEGIGVKINFGMVA
jgi:hypothetical protein